MVATKKAFVVLSHLPGWGSTFCFLYTELFGENTDRPYTTVLPQKVVFTLNPFLDTLQIHFLHHRCSVSIDPTFLRTHKDCKQWNVPDNVILASGADRQAGNTGVRERRPQDRCASCTSAGFPIEFQVHRLLWGCGVQTAQVDGAVTEGWCSGQYCGDSTANPSPTAFFNQESCCSHCSSIKISCVCVCVLVVFCKFFMSGEFDRFSSACVCFETCRSSWVEAEAPAKVLSSLCSLMHQPGQTAFSHVGKKTYMHRFSVHGMQLSAATCCCDTCNYCLRDHFMAGQ